MISWKETKTVDYTLIDEQQGSSFMFELRKGVEAWQM